LEGRYIEFDEAWADPAIYKAAAPEGDMFRLSPLAKPVPTVTQFSGLIAKAKAGEIVVAVDPESGLKLMTLPLKSVRDASNFQPYPDGEVEDMQAGRRLYVVTKMGA
jgi:hypothetical protein